LAPLNGLLELAQRQHAQALPQLVILPALLEAILELL